MKNAFILFCFLLVGLLGQAQTRRTVSGTVVDAATGEQLIGATVVMEGSAIGTTANTYGYFSLTLPAGPVQLRVGYLGYVAEVRAADLSVRDVNLGKIELRPSAAQLDEVVVSSARDRLGNHVRGTQMGTIDLPMAMLKRVPTIAGEVDIIKALQLTPGVKRGGEGTIGMYVRGGNVDENLILLDEATVYNAGHLLGFFSVFNSSALKDVQLYKSSFPSQYGGRLSSIMDVRLKEGNLHHYAAEGSLGIISSNLTVEGPLVKDKASFIVSGRRTYLDVVTGNRVPYHFYDLNGKLNFVVNERNRLYLSGYQGDDVLNANMSDDGPTAVRSKLRLGNATGSLRWNHLFKDPRLFANVSAHYTRFRYNVKGQIGDNSLLVASSIRDVGAKADLSFVPNTRHALLVGASLIQHAFRPNIVSTTGVISEALESKPGTRIGTGEFAVYANDDYALSERWQLNYGVRYSGLGVQGQLYSRLEPRVAGRYLLDERSSVKVSYARMAQYMHLVTSSSISLPTDLWYPATARVKPGTSDQASAGYYYAIPKWNVSLSVEGYYKWLQNRIEYREGAALLLNDDYEQELVTGRGRGYGAEFFATKTTGRFTGWLGYTLSYSKRQFDALNGGREYYSRFDRRHDVALVGAYDIRPRHGLAANFVYSSGSPFTAQTAQYIAPTPSFTAVDILPVYGGRNAVRLSPAIRIDVDYAYKFKPLKNVNAELHFSVYNLLNRTQPNSVARTVDSQTGDVKYEQRGLFGAIPSISLNFKR